MRLIPQCDLCFFQRHFAFLGWCNLYSGAIYSLKKKYGTRARVPSSSDSESKADSSGLDTKPGDQRVRAMGSRPALRILSSLGG